MPSVVREFLDLGFKKVIIYCINFKVAWLDLEVFKLSIDIELFKLQPGNS